MKIELSAMANPKLLQSFPTDPYADIQITSTLQIYQLQLAYLSIQSQYFQEVYANNEKKVELSHLPEPYLQQVLRSLYGDALTVESFGDLTKYYAVIHFLRIQEYQTRITEALKDNFQQLNPIELLEFCYSSHILEAEVKSRFIEEDLQCFESQKYYLQLNKIHPSRITKLLTEYLKESSNESKTTIVESVLDNYFNRNKLDPSEFFKQYKIPELASIWDQKHQHYLLDKILYTQPTQCDQMPKVPLICDSEVIKTQDTVRILQEELEAKTKRIKQLEIQNSSFQATILALQRQNKELREKKGSSPPNLVRFDDEEEESPSKTKLTMVESYIPSMDLDLGKSYRGHQIAHPQEQQDGLELGIESPMLARGPKSGNSLRTMESIKREGRSKKIFS